MVVRTADGILLHNHPELRIADSVTDEYRFDDIRPDDAVVDIGAHIGGFCIRAARYSSCVTAVEPVTFPELRLNIALNRAKVAVIEGALGDGKPRTVRWGRESRVCRTLRFRDIVDVAGGCDFLKCDCEGGEWSIDPADLSSVRRIEMEMHTPPISGPVNPRLLEYIGARYRFCIDRKTVHDAMGILGVLHAERREGP
jgi:FkbM family methyltransferase